MSLINNRPLSEARALVVCMCTVQPERSHISVSIIVQTCLVLDSRLIIGMFRVAPSRHKCTINLHFCSSAFLDNVLR